VTSSSDNTRGCWKGYPFLVILPLVANPLQDAQWRAHLEQFKGQVHHDFEEQRVRNYEYVKGQMQADLVSEVAVAKG